MKELPVDELARLRLVAAALRRFSELTLDERRRRDAEISAGVLEALVVFLTGPAPRPGPLVAPVNELLARIKATT